MVSLQLCEGCCCWASWLDNNVKHSFICHSIKAVLHSTDSKQSSNPLVVEIVPQQQTFNRNLILKDIIDSEKHHVTDLQSFMKTILTPIATSKM